MSSFNPRPSSFMGVLAWAATEARLKGIPFCPVKPTLVLDGCAVEWLKGDFDSMSPTHKYDVDVTDLSTGKVTTFVKVWCKTRTSRKTGKVTVSYSTPLGTFKTYDEVNAALVAEAQRRVAEALAAAAARAEAEAAQAEAEREAAAFEAALAEVRPELAARDLMPGGPTHDAWAWGLLEARTGRYAPRCPDHWGGSMYNQLEQSFAFYRKQDLLRAAAGIDPQADEPDVLAAPERHEQPQQRHYAGAQAVNVWPSAEEQALTRYRKWLGESACELDTEEGLRMAYQAAGAVECSEIAYGQKEDRALAILGSAVVALGGEVARLRSQVIAYEDALTPSAGTKYAYSGEFSIQREQLDENGDEVTVSYDVDWTTLKDVLAAVRARVQARVDGPHEQPEQQQAQRAGELFPHRSVAMLVESRCTRQDKALIPPEQRPELDDQMFERITQFDQQYRLNVEGQALFEHPDGPHEQPEQQQAQALAVAVAGFEPECRQCAALLDAKGQCPICPRPTPWEPCETGVRHHQTIPESREVAYAEHRKADRAATQARAEGADPARQRRLDEASQDAWTAFRRWRDADNFAARAGAHDHLRWADL